MRKEGSRAMDKKSKLMFQSVLITAIIVFYLILFAAIFIGNILGLFFGAYWWMHLFVIAFMTYSLDFMGFWVKNLYEIWKIVNYRLDEME